MLCSVPTGKSGSNWLDRLRSSKGFPTGDNLDLDHFLNNNDNHHDDDDAHAHAQPPNPSSSSPITNGASNSVNINSNSESTQSDSEPLTDRTTEKEWFGIMTNVLSDLFNMGDQEFSGKKKTARKQTNPKFCCVISTPTSTSNNDNNMGCARKEAAATSFNSDKNSNNGNADCGGDYDDDDDVEEEKGTGGGGGGGGDKELKGYSRSEVTVIDTSCGVWKFDKLVFRKKNIWKVRDKKGKSFTIGTKKRKPNDLESGNGNGNGYVGPKKKAKLSNSNFASSKDANDSQTPRDETREEVHKETSDDLDQVPKKRSPRKSKKSGSSVILLKAIDTNKKSERNLPKNRLKNTERPYKA